MSDKKPAPGTAKRTFKLFLLIFLVLLVPVVMDQAEVDRETVRTVGRVAAGITGALFCYGIFTKLLKTLAFVVLALIGTVVMVSEGTIKAPRLTEWWSTRGSEKK